jgi:hypothetical protein
MLDYTLTTETISSVFAEELARHSGRVTDIYDDGDRLFTRSVLPRTDEVKRKDWVQSGVALKATPDEICVCPYVFREICRNGAIMAQSLAARRLSRSWEQTPEQQISSVREAVGACCSEDVFAASVAEIRSSLQGEFSFALSMLSLVSRLPDAVSEDLMREVLDRFFGEGDRSRFGFMNAITSLARDRSNPEERWELEEFGGGVAAGIAPVLPHDTLERRLQCTELARVG